MKRRTAGAQGAAIAALVIATGLAPGAARADTVSDAAAAVER